MENKKFEIDFKRLNRKDREYLLSHYSKGATFNANMKQTNTTLIISLCAVFLSTFTLIFSVTEDLRFIVPFTIFVLCVLIFTYFKFSNASAKVKASIQVATKNYNDLFKVHFNYAQKKDKGFRKKDAK